MGEEITISQLARLEELVEQGNFADAAALVAQAHASDAAEALQHLERDDAGAIIRLIEPDKAADILEALPDDLAADALEEMSAKEAARIVTEMVSDEEADVLDEVSEERAEEIIEHLDHEQARMARELLAYDEDTAGGLLQKEFLSVDISLTATEARRQLQALGDDADSYALSYIYVVSNKDHFEGVLSLRSLLFAQPQTPIGEIMTRDTVTVPAAMDAADLAQLFRRQRLLSIPVLDSSGRMLGIVSQDDAMQYLKEESEEEFLRFSGIAGGEEVRDMPLAQRAGRRLIWLVIKMALNLIPASVVAHFTSTPAFVLLAPILPIISDMCGSGGSQAIAVSIRELSVGRIKAEDFTWVLGKELGIGLLNGLVLGTLLACGAYWFTKDVRLSGIVGFSMLASTIVAVTFGGLMPLLLRRLRVDPAVASSPVLTMVTDTCSFYFVLSLAVAIS